MKGRWSWSTAGRIWGGMSYLISIKALDYFVVRAWWGERIVIDLDHLRVTEVSEFEDLLLEHERKLVLAKLTQVVRKANPSYIGGSSMKLDEYDPTSVFFASPEVSRSEKPTIATSRFDCGCHVLQRCWVVSRQFHC